MRIILGGKVPNKIPYLDNLPLEGGEIKYLTLEEFQQKFNCEYFEGIKGNNDEYKLINPKDLQSPLEKAAYHRLMHPLDSLIICKMDSAVGHGLFAIKDISLGTVLCIYSGEYESSEINSKYKLHEIDAAKVGGVARFMQHLPILPASKENFIRQSFQDAELFSFINLISLEEARAALKNKPMVQIMQSFELSRLKSMHNEFDLDALEGLEADVRSTIADSNVYYKLIKVNGIELGVMIAMRDIKKHEIIGFSYAPTYWKTHSVQPLLFDKLGRIVMKEFKEIECVQKNVEEIEQKLQSSTLDFFKNQLNLQWKNYPESRLVGKYLGHHVRFFNMAPGETTQAKAFAERLQKQGFDAELKKAKDKPSVVVDLTTSTLTYK